MREEEKLPIWLLELRYMVIADKPLFAGLLEEKDEVPKWQQDVELFRFIKNGWATIEPGGFVITERGCRVYEKLWRDYGQTRKPFKSK
jgi:hypothetical protein